MTWQGTIYMEPTAKITLKAQDALSGTKQIIYSINGSLTNTYSIPIGFATAGTNYFDYFALDNLGNISLVTTVTLVSPLPDTTPPVTAILPQTNVYTNTASALYMKADANLVLQSEDKTGALDGYSSGVSNTFYSTNNSVAINSTNILLSEGKYVIGILIM